MFSKLVKYILPKRWVYLIQRRRMHDSIAAFHPHVVTHVYGAHLLSVYLADNLAEGWYDKDWPELEEIKFLRQGRLKPGAVVFDLGAHQGIVAMLLAKEVLPEGKVVAVEGTAHNASVAHKNLALNGIHNVQIVHALVADASAKSIAFSSTLNGSVNSSGVGEMVTSVSIDSLAHDQGLPDVVFIDIEGFECQALKGAATVIASGADFFVEIHVGCGLEAHGTVESVFSYFPVERYECFISPRDGAPFVPWSADLGFPTERFFLIARSLD